MENLKYQTLNGIDKLKFIMKSLRDPKSGCPWDIKQTFDSIASYTVEEAYEVLDAIEKKDLQSLKEELGDLLLQVIFHSQIAAEEGNFTFDDVVENICNKMVRRHPHVFGSEETMNLSQQMIAWEDLKEKERLEKGVSKYILDDIAKSLPALLRASKLQKRAARIGFDWPGWVEAFEKLKEEMDELLVELEKPNVDKDNVTNELGDVMFSAVNVARKLGIDPEVALRSVNSKFETRFVYMEDALTKQNKTFDDVTLHEMENLWQDSKNKI